MTSQHWGRIYFKDNFGEIKSQTMTSFMTKYCQLMNILFSFGLKLKKVVIDLQVKIDCFPEWRRSVVCIQEQLKNATNAQTHDLSISPTFFELCIRPFRFAEKTSVFVPWFCMFCISKNNVNT